MTLTTLLLTNCTNKSSDKSDALLSPLEGSWKLIYAEIKENDSLKIKDLSKSSFIKIINADHFAFFNQENNSSNNFYAGAGTYTLTGNNYVETLNYTSAEGIRGHQFPFTIKIKGDTLIQSGVEEIKHATIHREILEKYLKINP